MNLLETKTIKTIKEALKETYKRGRYLALTLVTATLIFLFNSLINNYKVLLSKFSFGLLLSLIAGTLTAISTISLISLIIFSILSGIVISMSVLLIQRQISNSIAEGSSSILISLIVPACPSCAFGLLSIIGLGGFLALLPFKGLELGFLGIILLLFFTVSLSKKITKKTCAINK